MQIADLIVKTTTGKYPIYIDAGVINNIADLYQPSFKGQKSIIITDSNVASYYLQVVTEGLKKSDWNVVKEIIIPAGEDSKSFSQVEKLSNTILEENIDRNTTIFALGGGVVGDLSGFIASILLRGIDFVQIPTTILAQVDSSVGGKTGVNNKIGKNLIGSFYQPKSVIIDTDTINTLPVRERKAGYAEIIKYGLIRDAEFFAWLQEHGQDIINIDKDALKYAIKKSCKIKAEIVAKDEKETNNLRAILNFGHTFGHGLEYLANFDDSKIKHGEAVAIGMLIATRLSEDIGLCQKNISKNLKKHLQVLNIPVKPHFYVNIEELLKAMYFDKKNKQGKINFILLEDIGKPIIKNDVSDNMILATLTEIAKEWT